MSVHSKFYSLPVAGIRQETPDAVSILFEVPFEFRSHFTFTAGQHLTLRTILDGEEIRRNYSVCVAPHDGELRVAVKRVSGGRFSNWANSLLKIGDLVEVMPPAGHFTIATDPSAARSYVGFAGGSGITPVISLLKTILQTEPYSQFTLFYGNRNSDQVMFTEELAQLKDRYIARFRLFHFLEEEEEEFELLNGRLDAAKCEELLSIVVDAPSVDQFFICGPEPMMNAAEAALKAKGVTGDKILLERFGQPGLDPERARLAAARAVQASGRSLGVIFDGRRVNIRFDAERGNILDTVIAAGLPAPYACKGGVCATCRGKVLTGEVSMAQNFGLTEAEIAQGYVLTCQSIPQSDDVLISYDD